MSDETSILGAIQQIAEEKGISSEAIIGAIESALAAAYRKDFGEKNQNIKVNFNPATGAAEVFDVKTVVEDELAEAAKAREEEAELNKDADKIENRPKASDKMAETEEAEKRFNPKTDIALSEAAVIKTDAQIGDEIRTPLSVPSAYGRMAAQTAKQVIIQKLREAEHTNVYELLKAKERQLVTGVVQRRDARAVYIDLGRGTGIMPPEEQVDKERYAPGDRLKVYIVSVSTTPKGPEIIVSRSHTEVVRQIFATEIPEITNGLIAIRGISREAGSRSKVAVEALDPNVDPIGSCVGQRGARVQTIIGELGGEKIDIIEFSNDAVRYITNALSPAKVLMIEADEAARVAVAAVAEDQLSLAIGKGGQNVRLAAHLTGWKIDIRSESGDLQQISDDEEVPLIEEEGDDDAGPEDALAKDKGSSTD